MEKETELLPICPCCQQPTEEILELAPDLRGVDAVLEIVKHQMETVKSNSDPVVEVAYLLAEIEQIRSKYVEGK